MPQESPSIYGSDLIAKHRHLKIYAEAVILVALNPVSMQCLSILTCFILHLFKIITVR